ncbi:hypothetical protein [Paenibacillus sonchi]|nr:hypothetical protein [Paenibacillus sonchi]
MSFMEQQEQKEVTDLEDMYRQSVMLSFNLGEVLSERIQRLPESTSPDPLAYPPCHYRTYMLDEYPVHQLSYQGMLPLYMKEKQYKNKVRDYYIRATMEATARLDIPSLRSAFIYIGHFFENLMIRDLDNRNRSFLINAIRYAGFIEDDSWKEIEVMESGFLDLARKNHVQIFITPSENAMKMIENVRRKYASGHDFSGMFEPDNHPMRT